MIQRIQTIYLILAALAAILMIFVPVGSIADIESKTAVAISVKQIFPLLLGCILSGIVAVVSIFLFRNYTLQMNVIKFNILLGALLVGGLCYFLFLEPTTRISMPGIGLPLPLFAIIFNFLALKGVKHDHGLIKSYDRLR